ncbi:UDP-glucuronosyltransferase 2B17-like isoform X2 [Agrilus planipennis]|uniref:UDP-glucuronosyltransferase n=1 Tax=Agrilus planipennis TaxID=224129 RepID=A0A1W4WYV3_AGRPL|nr:UDP-glucuronosyltransferase 2B17-like isoform X2 [Agrilus planipennis]XP_018329060.1 UDP-glucuronosyltransferase 2B17-like isoform X2 [Agrilus planipennis]XP_018329061.1 UDP-glucuronosyltransferase 2B17-like isoform X2 [Agrilus planipennis]
MCVIENLAIKDKVDPTTFQNTFMSLVFDGGKHVLEDENVQKEIFKPGLHFDLIIIHKFGEELLTGLSYHFKAPYILLSTIGQSFVGSMQVGLPGVPAYLPDFLINISPEMCFFQRLINTVIIDSMLIYGYFFHFRKLDNDMQKFFPGAPSVSDLYFNVSLYLWNSHPSYGFSLPSVPNAIDVGGFHVSDPKPLPKDLKTILDGAKDGAIFFSLGSNVRAFSLPNETKDGILKSFSKLKQVVLWKFEDPELPNKPKNVHISKWYPQQDILAHPNVKLFITHGGLLSLTEAVYNGVPIIGIPVFGDQFYNVEEAVKQGYAYKVLYNEMNEKNFDKAIGEMLNNKKYYENMKEKSRVFHDRPVKPLDSTIYWIEYVIRHRGAPHLRSITANLSWIQLQLLDVYATLLVLLFIAFKCIQIVIRKIVNKICNCKSSKKEKTIKKTQ